MVSGQGLIISHWIEFHILVFLTIFGFGLWSILLNANKKLLFKRHQIAVSGNFQASELFFHKILYIASSKIGWNAFFSSKPLESSALFVLSYQSACLLLREFLLLVLHPESSNDKRKVNIGSAKTLSILEWVIYLPNTLGILWSTLVANKSCLLGLNAHIPVLNAIAVICQILFWCADLQIFSLFVDFVYCALQKSINRIWATFRYMQMWML